MISSCAILFLSHSTLQYSEWRYLAEYLAGLEYILPAKRIVSDTLMIALVQRVGWTAAKHKSYTIETHFSQKTQEDCLKWIQDYNSSATPHS